MRLHQQRQSLHHRICALLLCVCSILFYVLPQPVLASELETQTIRVGRFPYDEQLQRDADGQYSGYGYDYLQEIAKYTGWEYEFVDSTWNECLAMLERGEIDLMGAVMRSPEREAKFDFSEYSMISGYGVLATSLDNETLPYEDFEAFDGMRTGVLKNNLHRDTFLEYSRAHQFSPIIQEYATQAELEAALQSGKISAAVMTNLLRSTTLRVVASFGENDGYFATTKGNTAILTPLNEALRQIRMSDPYYNSKLDQKYYDVQTATAISFTREELEFIQQSDSIPYAFIPAAPFSSLDASTGKPQGIALDICRILEEQTGLSFHFRNSDSASEAITLLRRGEVLFIPAKYNDLTWAENNGALLTSPYLKGQMIMVTNSRAASPEVVALYDQASQSSMAADSISKGAQIKEYDTALDCMNAVLDGTASTTFINSTIASYWMNNPKYAGLHTTPLYNVSADVTMAVSSEANPLLLSVLNKGLRSISSTKINQLVLSQMKNNQSDLLANFLYLHPFETISMISAILIALILVLLLLFYIRRKNMKQLRKTFYTDVLTKRPNYQAMLQEAPKLISKHPTEYALLYMDIRRFKVINDTFGYETGNLVLTTVSDILQKFLTPEERMARIHADTFALLLHFSDQEQLRERVELLSQKLDQLSYGTSNVKPLFRGGVYLLSDEMNDLDRACDRANYTKGSLSQHFTNTFVFYDDVVHHRMIAEKELESGMFSALQQSEFVPFYQPKVNAITGNVIGAEALVRWQHPEKGVLMPGEFLPFYEETGFIVKIDLAVFEQVCRDLQQWMQSGKPLVPVSVNFSRKHMQNAELPDKLKAIADQYQIPAHLLEIEITETKELESMEIADQFVGALKKHGFSISIDDYGTGYSSISFIQQLQLDTLKLDRQFILNAMQSDKARDIMRYLVTAMQKNNIRILCEGIETTEQKDFVISLNCRFIQGYLYSRPLPKGEFEAFLRHSGTDTSDNLDFIPIVNFEKSHWMGVEDFLDKAMPSWIFSCLTDPGYPITYMSPGFLEALGYGELELITATDGRYVNLVHPEDVPIALELLNHRPHSTQDLVLQYRVRKKDGSYLWLRENNKRILTHGGQEALLGICTNVTDIVSLQEEKNRIIETIPGGMSELQLTENGPIVLQASSRFYELVGHTPEEMASFGNNLSHILYEKDMDYAMKMLQHVLESGVLFCECTFRVRHKDQSLHWLTFRGTISHTLPQPQATMLVFNNDEKIHAQQLSEMERTKLELAVASAGQALFEYNLKTKSLHSYSGFSAYGIEDKNGLQVPFSEMNKDLVHPDDLGKIQKAMESLLSGQTRVSYEARIHSNFQDGNSPYIWIRITLSVISDAEQQPVWAIGIVENIHQQKSFEHALFQEAQYRKAFTESSLMAYEFNLTENTIQRIMGSRGFRLQELCERLEHPGCYSDTLTAGARFLVAEGDRERFVKETSREYLMQLYQNGVTEKELEYRRITPDGKELWNAALIYLLSDQLSGDVMGYAYHRDIHERKLTEKDLAEQAAHDPLTGVLNRSSAEKEITAYFAKQIGSKQASAFLMIDLDRFKAINDSYGHLTGDQYLQKLADIINRSLRKGDFVARMGGDEFAVLLKQVSGQQEALAVVNRFAQEVAKIQTDLGITLQTSVSVGVSLFPVDGTDFQTLYRKADEAMYQAKQVPGTNVVVYHEQP